MNYQLAKALPVFVLVAATQANASIVIDFEDQPLGTPSNFVQEGLLIEFLQFDPSEGVIDNAGNPGQALSSYGDGPIFRLRITTLSGDDMVLDGFDYDITNVSGDTTIIGARIHASNGFLIDDFIRNDATGGYLHADPFNAQFHRLEFLFESMGSQDSVHLDNIAITIIPAPGAGALLGVSGLLAARRRR
jgi:hypothetical protein